MFEQIEKSFGKILRQLKGYGKLTDRNISETSREIRKALLEADVNYKVVKEFVAKVTESAKGKAVLNSVSPGQQFVKIIHEELTILLGEKSAPLTFSDKPPTVILMAGLQGSGKTTTAAKLANLLKKQGKRSLLVAADVYRPAAVDQLVILGKQIDIPVWQMEYDDPIKICVKGIEEAKSEKLDVVILDTAGRLHVDSEMMEEIVQIAENTNPHEILYVADGMTGQDAVNSSDMFNSALGITGTILTKMDGDARGGAALSITTTIGKPIKFVGVGEKLNALEPFHPDRMAGRILGMGDVVSLVEKAEGEFDKEKAEKDLEKIRTNQFTLEDFREQFGQMQKLGSMDEILSLIPGINKKNIVMDEKQIVWTNAIIDSMTPAERRNPVVINGSRKKRISMGSGRSVQEINSLLKQFEAMKKMMKTLTNKNPLMKQFKGMIN
tara:strand:+ start:122 stop:1438 length:1317 start_codon:yes stop_codon:yes gene_type:complete